MSGGMFDKLSEFGKWLFGVDIEGGGLGDTVHANKLILSGLTAEYDEATATATLAGLSSYSPSWHRTVVDFRTLASQTLLSSVSSSDTTLEYTLGGQTFQLWHPAGFHASAPFCLRNVLGSGLQIGAAANTNDVGGNYNRYTRISHPRFVWPFSNNSNITLMTPFRCGVLLEASACEHYPTSQGSLSLAAAWQDSLDMPNLGQNYNMGQSRHVMGLISSGAGGGVCCDNITGVSVYNGAMAGNVVRHGRLVDGSETGWSGILGLGCRTGCGALVGELDIYGDMRLAPSLDMELLPLTSHLSEHHFGQAWDFELYSSVQNAIDPANWGVEISWQTCYDSDLSDAQHSAYPTIAGLVIEAWY